MVVKTAIEMPGLTKDTTAYFYKRFLALARLDGGTPRFVRYRALLSRGAPIDTRPEFLLFWSGLTNCAVVPI
jgi:hypothetical protein